MAPVFIFLFWHTRLEESILAVDHLSYRTYGLISIGGIPTFGARVFALSDKQFGW